ncbi:MAG: serine protease [Sedimentitalea sp.]
MKTHILALASALLLPMAAHAQQTGLASVAVPLGGDDVAVKAHVLDLKERADDPLEAETASRIFGGRAAKEGAWPAQVSLHDAKKLSNQPESRFKSQFCGGSLIARQWILTAAHCVVTQDGEPMVPNTLAVRSGAVDMRGGDFREVARVIVHESYDPTRINNDIALLQLAQPVQQSSGPVGAISVHGEGQPLPNGPAVVIGWGMMENGKFPIELMETDIDIVQNATCNAGMAEQTKRDMGGFLLNMGQANGIPMENLERAYSILTQEIGDALTPQMICAGIASGQRTMCNGDSGGPLMVRQQNGQWLQVGIVSWNRSPIGARSACGHESLYGVYTRVSQYYNWIARHVQG